MDAPPSQYVKPYVKSNKTLAGAGVIMATDWLVGRELAEGRLVSVLTDWSVTGEAGVSVVRASVRHAPAKTRVFVEWIVDLFDNPPWASRKPKPD